MKKATERDARRTAVRDSRKALVAKFIKQECVFGWRHILHSEQLKQRWEGFAKGQQAFSFNLFSKYFRELSPSVVIKPRVIVPDKDGNILGQRMERVYFGITLRYRPQRLRKGRPRETLADAGKDEPSGPCAR